MTTESMIKKWVRPGQYGRLLINILPFGRGGRDTARVWVLPKGVTLNKAIPGPNDDAVLVYSDGVWLHEGVWKEDLDGVIDTCQTERSAQLEEGNNDNSSTSKAAHIQQLLTNYTNDV